MGGKYGTVDTLEHWSTLMAHRRCASLIHRVITLCIAVLPEKS